EGIGVNWGREASHTLPPERVVELLKSNKISGVKLLDADPQSLRSLAGSGIPVTVGIPNSLLYSLNSSFKAAQDWVRENLTGFVSGRVLIENVAVGDSPFLRSYGDQFHPLLVGAADNIQRAVSESNLGTKIKVVIPCDFNVFEFDSNLPSKTLIRSQVNSTMIRILTFLNLQKSPFFTAISPFRILRDSDNFTLEFALFKETPRQVNDTRRNYTNIFDLAYDAVLNALTAAGFPGMQIVVGEIGWPTDGAVNATPYIAQEFNSALINHLDSISTRPSKPSEVYIFSLLDEDERNTTGDDDDFERHWGIFTFDGQAKYELDLGRGTTKLTNARDVRYLAAKWCVVDDNKDISGAAVSLAADACAAADCSALAPGGSCFNLSWPGNLSYAFNSYYQRHDQDAGSCGFDGLGLITTVDPSTDGCRFVIGINTSGSKSLL
ncbi:hypothetical protein M569_16510, partial [Genlisea aurea]